LAANAAIFLCILLAGILPGLWPGQGGRDFIPQAFTAGIFILFTAIVLRYKCKWPVSHMMLSLLPTQVIVLACTSYFSGYTGKQILNPFNLEWQFHIDLILCIPWIVGVLAGSFALHRKT
jgi:hypothetical protein